jgi:hypothetical protein
LFILLDGELFCELAPVDEGLGLELAVVEEEVDLFGGEGDVEEAEGFFEHQVGDAACFLLVYFGEGLL